MNKTLFCALPLILLSSNALANQEVNTFINAGALDYRDTTTAYLSGRHYFSAQTANGVYDEFGYFDTDSKIGATYSYSDNPFGTTSSQGIGGEYFHGNFLIGGDVFRQSFDYDSNESSFSQSTLKLGYLFNDNLLVSAYYNDRVGEGYFNAQYSHELNSRGDYIGFSIGTSEDLDNYSLSSSYFGKLNGDNYIRLGIHYAESDGYDNTEYSGSYYFSESTSVSVTSDFDFRHEISAKHYFTEATAVYFGYTYVDSEHSDDLIQVALSSQF